MIGTICRFTKILLRIFFPIILFHEYFELQFNISMRIALFAQGKAWNINNFDITRRLIQILLNKFRSITYSHIQGAKMPVKFTQIWNSKNILISNLTRWKVGMEMVNGMEILVKDTVLTSRHSPHSISFIPYIFQGSITMTKGQHHNCYEQIDVRMNIFSKVLKLVSKSGIRKIC